MSKKLYEFTDKHRAQLKPHAEFWIKNAMSTKPMDDEDKRISREAVKGLYRAAGLTPPPDHRIVFVPSPFVGRFAAGFAAAIWHQRKTGFKDAATYAATSAATDAATYAATRDATSDATYAATDDATSAATSAATRDATRDATYAATSAATDAATYAATSAATYAATYAATRDATSDATYAATDDATSAATSAATDAATYAATSAATYAATYAATRDATSDATYAATDDATRDATYAATSAATSAATDAATYAATSAATYAATYAATSAATSDADLSKWYRVDLKGLAKVGEKTGAGLLGIKCAYDAYKFWQGGNQWSAWISFLTFFRYVAKLPLDYSKFDHYEKLALHSGPRWMHKEFCIISDRPEVLTVNTRNQPHNENGPFCKWRDGSALYSMNGVRVPAWIAETPKEKITKGMFVGEQNADIRREIAKKIGITKVVELLGANVIDSEDGYELLSVDLGDRRGRPYLKMKDASIDAWHIEGCRPGTKTVKEAIMYRNGLTQYVQPVKLT